MFCRLGRGWAAKLQASDIQVCFKMASSS